MDVWSTATQIFRFVKKPHLTNFELIFRNRLVDDSVTYTIATSTVKRKLNSTTKQKARTTDMPPGRMRRAHIYISFNLTFQLTLRFQPWI